MTERVVVTGMGAVTPLGNSVDEFLTGLFAGQVGIKPITKFDATPTGITVAGERKDWIYFPFMVYTVQVKRWRKPD